MLFFSLKMGGVIKMSPSCEPGTRLRFRGNDRAGTYTRVTREPLETVGNGG